MEGSIIKSRKANGVPIVPPTPEGDPNATRSITMAMTRTCLLPYSLERENAQEKKYVPARLSDDTWGPSPAAAREESAESVTRGPIAEDERRHREET